VSCGPSTEVCVKENAKKINLTPSHTGPYAMVEKVVIVALTVLFFSLFFTRNLLVQRRTGKSIRTRDRLVATSMVLSTACFVVTILSVFSQQWHHGMGAIGFLRHPFVAYSGLVIFAAGIVGAWILSGQLKDSWRVGVADDQKTELIQDGIYASIRNPYFLCYYLMFFGLFLVRPSLVLLVLVPVIIAVFHRMVLKEEAYLHNKHGKAYEEYRKKTGRYIPRMWYIGRTSSG
jgi:protein-S-isoprenylcysteine O-methyltransferase Ste14